MDSLLKRFRQSAERVEDVAGVIPPYAEKAFHLAKEKQELCECGIGSAHERYSSIEEAEQKLGAVVANFECAVDHLEMVLSRRLDPLTKI